MESGYVKLSRSLGQNWLLRHPKALSVFILFLVEAQWKPRKYATKYGVIDLDAGQCLTALRPLAKRLDMSVKEIRHALKLLIGAHTIKIETTPNYSIITLVNWRQYQTNDDEGHTQGTPRAHPGHKNKQVNHSSIEALNPNKPDQPIGWNPFGVLMEIFKEHNVVTAVKNGKHIGMVNNLKKSVDEKTFRAVASAYCKDSFRISAGLSVSGFINAFDSINNKINKKPVDESMAVTRAELYRKLGGR
jgi:hypothetical protein